MLIVGPNDGKGDVAAEAGGTAGQDAAAAAAALGDATNREAALSKSLAFAVSLMSSKSFCM